MQSVTTRQGQTSSGIYLICPRNDSRYTYSIGMINVGNNFNSKLEIVSALNSFNIGLWQCYFHAAFCYQKYNPKVYLGAVQSVAEAWNNDSDSGHQSLGQDGQKSGSWPVNQLNVLVILTII